MRVTLSRDLWKGEVTDSRAVDKIKCGGCVGGPSVVVCESATKCHVQWGGLR